VAADRLSDPRSGGRLLARRPASSRQDGPAQVQLGDPGRGRPGRKMGTWQSDLTPRPRSRCGSHLGLTTACG
jgi:hypothetical protein